jgi:hypothetical protein
VWHAPAVVRWAWVWVSFSIAGCYLSHGRGDVEPVEDAGVVGECFGEAVTLTVGPGAGCARAMFEGTTEVTGIVLRPAGTPLRIRRLGGPEPTVRFRALRCPTGATEFSLWQVGSTFSDCENAMSWRTRCDGESDRTFTWRWLAAGDEQTEMRMAGEGIDWEVEACVP